MTLLALAAATYLAARVWTWLMCWNADRAERDEPFPGAWPW